MRNVLTDPFLWFTMCILMLLYAGYLWLRRKR